MQEINPEHAIPTGPEGPLPEPARADLSGLDARLPAPPAAPQPSPGGASITLDLTSHADQAKLSPEVRSFAATIGAISARSVRIGAVDHATVSLARAHTIAVIHPDVRRVLLDRTIQFSAEISAGGDLTLRDIRGVELDIGRFMPSVRPREVTIKPDGSFLAEAVSMGMVGRRGGILPASAHDLLRKALADFDGLQRAQSAP